MNIQSSYTGKTNGTLRVAFCMNDVEWIKKLSQEELYEAAIIQQKYIATGLCARGHHLTFVAPQNIDHLVSTPDPHEIKDVPVTWSGGRWFEIARKGTWRIQKSLGIPYLNVFSNLRRFDASMQCLSGHDVVFERNSLYNSFVARACLKLKLPYIMFFDADQILESDYLDTPITGLLRKRANQLLRFNLNAADAIICVSETARQNLNSSWNVPFDKMVVFPNAADVHKFAPNQEARLKIRTSLGINDQLLFIFVGSFYKWHDVGTLIKAFALLLESNPEARLVLVGEGAQHKEMMQLANELCISHAVIFTGKVAHTAVPSLLNAADIAVAPYPMMNKAMWLSPLKLFEYMASGLAVIATNVGQLNEVIKNGENGLLVSPEDHQALASALRKLVEDSLLRSQLARQARVDALHNYSWESYLSHLEDLLSSVIAKHKAARK
jgi:glycosyltransferase involved in cell wall biosynthesis